MLSEEDILTATRAIRPLLPSLLGTKAEVIDRQLAKLIHRSEGGEIIGQDIVKLLLQEEPTHNWFKAYFSDTAGGSFNFEILYVKPTPIKADRYACSVKGCVTVWYKQRPDDQIPICQSHGVTLVLSPKGK